MQICKFKCRFANRPFTPKSWAAKLPRCHQTDAMGHTFHPFPFPLVNSFHWKQNPSRRGEPVQPPNTWVRTKPAGSKEKSRLVCVSLFTPLLVLIFLLCLKEKKELAELFQCFEVILFTGSWEDWFTRHGECREGEGDPGAEQVFDFRAALLWILMPGATSICGQLKMKGWELFY